MKANTRAFLISAAADELCANDGTFEMKAVAERACVSVGLAYHYFDSKAGLLAAVVTDFYDRFEAETIYAVIADDAGWIAREQERLRRVIEFYYCEPLSPIFFTRLSREPGVAALEANRLAAQVETGRDNLAQAQRQGLIPPTIDPDLASGMVLGGVRAAVGRALQRTPRPSPDDLARQIWALIAGSLHLNGVEDEQEISDDAEHRAS